MKKNNNLLKKLPLAALMSASSLIACAGTQNNPDSDDVKKEETAVTIDLQESDASKDSLSAQQDIHFFDAERTIENIRYSKKQAEMQPDTVIAVDYHTPETYKEYKNTLKELNRAERKLKQKSAAARAKKAAAKETVR